MPRRIVASPFVVACAIAIALGCAVRARPVLLTDFPLNDGGLFFQMTEELQHAHYRLPMLTGYNAMQIPFAYPPFGFYMAGLVSDALSVDLMQVFRLLPLVTTCATLVAFLLLARAMLPERTAVVAAVTAFALVPRSFMWLVMGGGLTRAFGLLFTILALHQAYLLFTRRDLRYAVSAGVFTGLTPMSHLGTAPFLAASLVLFFLAYGRHRKGLIGAVIIGALAVAVTAPWWATVAARHGFGPFLAAGQTSGSIFSHGQFRSTVLGRLARFGAPSSGEPLFPVLGALAVLGSLAALRRRAVLLPVWWMATLALDVRAGETYATLPLALLAGIAVNEVLFPLLLRRRGVDRGVEERPSTPTPDRASSVGWSFPAVVTRARENMLAVAVVAFLLAYCTLGALTRNADLGTEAAYLASLSHDDRDAMQWVASNTAPSSRFLVVPAEGWPADRVAEWFPVLARRQSVATVQGTEWLPDSGFARYKRLYDTARDCRSRDVSCVEQWSSKSGVAFSYVYVPGTPDSGCCRALRSTLRSDDRYQLVFDGPGAEIFARRAAAASTAGSAPNAPQGPP
jgi:hypothetical protein